MNSLDDLTRRPAPAANTWQRWEMGSIARPAPARPTPAAPPRPREPAPDPAELERLRQQAREAGIAEGRRAGLAQGHEQGYAAGLAAGKAAMEQQAAQLLATAASLPAALRRAEQDLAGAVVALALDLARHVVQRSLQAQPQLLVPLVQDLLRREPALQGEPRLLLHPLDAELVAGVLGAELQAAGWQVLPDDNVTRGGCLVKAGSGAHDATLETRWSRLSAALAAGTPLS
ncbi:MAG: flagellar assembly protein FliH [Ramlibacter sp.]